MTRRKPWLSCIGCLKQPRIALRKKLNHVIMVQKEKKNMKCWTPPKGKGKEKVFDEPSSSKTKTKDKSDCSPDEECFHCHKKGHSFRNCKKYLEELNKKGSETSTLGINVIEINIALSSSDS
jgi:endonuclease IV